MDVIVGQLLIVYSIKFFLVITAFSYFAQFLQYFLHKIVWKIFVLRFLAFLNPKPGRNDHCTMPKDSFCRCFGLRFCLDQVKFQLFCLSQIFQNSLQKNADLSNFPSLFGVKLSKNLPRNVNVIWKDKYFNFAGV